MMNLSALSKGNFLETKRSKERKALLSETISNPKVMQDMIRNHPIIDDTVYFIGILK